MRNIDREIELRLRWEYGFYLTFSTGPYRHLEMNELCADAYQAFTVIHFWPSVIASDESTPNLRLFTDTSAVIRPEIPVTFGQIAERLIPIQQRGTISNFLCPDRGKEDASHHPGVWIRFEHVAPIGRRADYVMKKCVEIMRALSARGIHDRWPHLMGAWKTYVLYKGDRPLAESLEKKYYPSAASQ